MNRQFSSESSPELPAASVVPAAHASTDRGWRDAPTLPHGDPSVPVVLPPIPGFEILQELGRGGMGVVYKARDLANNQIVAIKVLLSGPHAGRLERERFRREMVAAEALQHENVVKLLGAGDHAGQPYLVLEYVDGGSLADRLNGQPWDPAAAIQLVSQIAVAVQFAHVRGFIHRDLKPANVLMTGDSSLTPNLPKVTDFGLSKFVSDVGSSRPATETGAVVGTPSYISPEQALGNAIIGPTADVYSLGAMFYELLTGRPPFDGKTSLDTVLKVLNETPMAPSKLVPTLSSDLEAIVMKCLEKDLDRRYASVGELLADLERFQSGVAVVARPVSATRRLLSWFSRKPRVSSISATAAVMVVIVLGVILAAMYRVHAAADRAAAAVHAAEQSQREAEQARAEAERIRDLMELERQCAAEIHAKYEQLRAFLHSLPSEKLAQRAKPIEQFTDEPETTSECEQSIDRTSSCTTRRISTQLPMLAGRLLLAKLLHDSTRTSYRD